MATDLDMMILAVDTTTKRGSVAVTDGGRVLALVEGDASRTHGERLPGEIAAALDRAGIDRRRIDLLAVATGPGAFTGLRIGLAAVQGLSMALGKPVVGVSALDALAAQVDEAVDLVVPWMDAQRGDVFATVIQRRSGETIDPPLAAAPKALLEHWPADRRRQSAIFIGDAVVRDAAIIAALGGAGWQTRTPAPLTPQIATLAERAAAHGEPGLPHALTPIYVRRPDAEIDRERRR